MRPSPALLESLSRSRLFPGVLAGTSGVGERRSATRGPGLEFIDHRPYQDGDDTRRIDPHVYARTGQFHLREYARDQQLPVTVLIDTSASITAGGEGKENQARALAQIVGFAAMAGGDTVQIAVSGPRGLQMSPRWQGLARAEDLFGWINELPVGAGGPLPDALRQIAGRLRRGTLLVIISDWWDEDIETALGWLGAAGYAVLALQVLSQGERDPGDLASGTVTFEDIETGEATKVDVDHDTLEAYRSAFAAHQEGLQAAFRARGWPFVTVTDDTDLTEFCLRELRGMGVLA